MFGLTNPDMSQDSDYLADFMWKHRLKERFNIHFWNQVTLYEIHSKNTTFFNSQI